MSAMAWDIQARVMTATFTRPEKLNSITEEFLADLATVVAEAESDRDVCALVFRGSGRAFSVGLDLELLRKAFADATYLESVVTRLGGLLSSIEHLDIPVVAAVNGIARAGGFELLVACDLVIVADEAQVGDVHTNFGVMTAAGTARRLPAKIGDQRAKELLFTARWLSGPQAVDFGIALRSVPAADLDAAVEALLRELRNKPRRVLGAVKRAIRRSAGVPESEAMAAELSEFLAVATGSDSDGQEGFQAYLEGRAPSWAAESPG